jgi:hypothetical protein
VGAGGHEFPDGSPACGTPPTVIDPCKIDPGLLKCFSTSVTVDTLFSSGQSQEINDAMKVIFSMFGGADKFYAATGIPNLQFKYVTTLSCTQSNAVGCYAGNGVIELMNGSLQPGSTLIPGWYIAHEVAHAFDFSLSGGNPELYRSQTFVDHFVPQNRIQDFLNIPSCKVRAGIGCSGAVWTSRVTGTNGTKYGKTNSVEDFADTFSVLYALSVTQTGLPYNSFSDPWRIDEPNRIITGRTH